MDTWREIKFNREMWINRIRIEIDRCDSSEIPCVITDVTAGFISHNNTPNWSYIFLAMIKKNIYIYKKKKNIKERSLSPSHKKSVQTGKDKKERILEAKAK